MAEFKVLLSKVTIEKEESWQILIGLTKLHMLLWFSRINCIGEMYSWQKKKSCRKKEKKTFNAKVVERTWDRHKLPSNTTFTGFVPSSILFLYLLTPALWYGWICWSLFHGVKAGCILDKKRINNSTDSESHLDTIKEFPPRLPHVRVLDFGRKPEKPQKTQEEHGNYHSEALGGTGIKCAMCF